LRLEENGKIEASSSAFVHSGLRSDQSTSGDPCSFVAAKGSLNALKCRKSEIVDIFLAGFDITDIRQPCRGPSPARRAGQRQRLRPIVPGWGGPINRLPD
jgi:hypothetical protein